MRLMTDTLPSSSASSALLWLSHLLLATCALLLSGIYFPTTIHYTFPLAQFIALLAGAIAFAAIALRKLRAESDKRSVWPIFIALAIFITFMPWPYRLVGILLFVVAPLGAGGAEKVDSSDHSRRPFDLQGRMPKGIATKLLSPLGNGLWFVGLVMAAQFLLLPVYYLLFSRFHRLDFLTPFMTLLVKAFGVEAANSSGALFVREAGKVYSFLTSWDSLGLYPILNIWIGGLLTIWLFRQDWRKLISLTLTLAIYLLLRYTAVIFIFLNVQQASVFWQYPFTFLTLLPLAFILLKVVPLELRNTNGPSVIPKMTASAIHNPKSTMRTAALCLLIFSLVGLWGFHDPGIEKAGRVLIDEKHSNWEWTTEEFDTQWYGYKSTYNYFSLFEYLRNFYSVGRSHETITTDLLRGCDVFIIKTPTDPFTEQEIGALVEFVRQGGGLFLIGDHTNVFGTSTNLNPLATRFGLRFRYDFQSDISSELSVYRPPKVLPHPVVQHVPVFMFASGCMMEAPITAENVIIGYGQRSLYLDYAEKNFFPRDKTNEETMEFGLFLQSAGVRFGKGRVLGFTDSTVWSNFYMHIPGKPELLLGSIAWLNRRNSAWSFLKILFLLMAGASMLILLKARIRPAREEFWPIAIFSLALVLPIATHAFALINKQFYPVPRPQRDFVQVNFEMEHSNYELPILHMSQQMERSFSTFYVWLQRLGMVPAVKTDFEDAMRGGNALVIINPAKPFTHEETKSFEKFLEDGGKALVLADANTHGAASQLLSSLGLQIQPVWQDSQAVFSWRKGMDSLSFAGKFSAFVTGGRPVVMARVTKASTFQPQLTLFPKPGEMASPPAMIQSQSPLRGNDAGKDLLKPALAIQRRGKGVVAVMSSSSTFTDREMGTGAAKPNANMQAIYDLEFWIFTEVLGLKERSEQKGLVD